MLRISRMADYAVVLTTSLAKLARDELRAVSALTEETRIPQPTVSKLLKALGREGLLESARGARGGYRLARPADEINVADVISAIEGPIGVTECGVDESELDCGLSEGCGVRGNWRLINLAILSALEGITLAQMAAAPGPALVQLGRGRRTPEAMGGRS